MFSCHVTLEMRCRCICFSLFVFLKDKNLISITFPLLKFISLPSLFSIFPHLSYSSQFFPNFPSPPLIVFIITSSSQFFPFLPSSQFFSPLSFLLLILSLISLPLFSLFPFSLSNLQSVLRRPHLLYLKVSA